MKSHLATWTVRCSTSVLAFCLLQLQSTLLAQLRPTRPRMLLLLRPPPPLLLTVLGRWNSVRQLRPVLLRPMRRLVPLAPRAMTILADCITRARAAEAACCHMKTLALRMKAAAVRARKAIAFAFVAVTVRRFAHL